MIIKDVTNSLTVDKNTKYCIDNVKLFETGPMSGAAAKSTYAVSQKNRATIHSFITLANGGRF